jgi:hypothetical protein
MNESRTGSEARPRLATAVLACLLLGLGSAAAYLVWSRAARALTSPA